MTKKHFQSEIRRAETLKRLADEPGQADYYAGYIRGLRRAFHGENFGTIEEHNKLCSLVNDEDKSRKQRGLGYLAGLNF